MLEHFTYHQCLPQRVPPGRELKLIQTHQLSSLQTSKDFCLVSLTFEHTLLLTSSKFSFEITKNLSFRNYSKDILEVILIPRQFLNPIASLI